IPETIINDGTKKPAAAKKLAVSQIQLEQALKQLFLPKSQQAPETALFYFSGHGLPDTEGLDLDKGYLATSDTDPHVPRSGLSLRWLQQLLSKSPIKQQIVWLDCCHSGSLIINVEAANPGNGESRDRCFIASSRDFESSWEDLNSPYSVLTKALLDGLDPTRLPGRWIDTFALVDYINQALKGELQTPVCTNFGEAINLTRTWQVPNQPSNDSQTDSGICPYKGLEFFDCNDEDPKYFFGRDRLIGQLLDHVRTNNFLALVGASGNGKSSVLRAGLLHQLKLGRRIAGSDRWRIRITRPDRQPMQNLALAFVDEGLSDLDRAEALGRATGLLNEGASGLQRLVQAATAPRVILVIDQFEEVFTRCDSAEAREQFFACLMGALASTDDKLCLIIAIRADFVGKCLERDYSGLANGLRQDMVPVLPMEPNELKAATCKPAEQVGLEIEPALVPEILNDITGAPGSLPLLQYTLKELWQKRQGNRLVLSAYQALGGINGTLDHRATEIYNSFDTVEQRTVQHIFQQLTQLGEGTEDTRRRVFQADLVAEPQHPAAQVQTVIDRLSSPENRLLVTSEVVSKGNESDRMAIVDVAHEALIRHWKLLRQWIEQNRDLLRQQRKIEANAVAWRDQGKKVGYLLQGLPLTEAILFNKQQHDRFPLSDPAKQFIRQSIKQRRWNRLKTASWLIIPALVVVGIVEHSLHEASVKADIARLDQEGTYEEKQAVEALVEGCHTQQQMKWLLPYLTERLFGNCRPIYQAPLEKADLNRSNLSSAHLSNANLNNANLSNAHLNDASLFSAHLNNANLSNADLSNAQLFSAHLSNADLNRANLSNAQLSKADLNRANLSNAHLFSAHLNRANLSNADLSNARLSYANLSYANLSNANLTNADFSNSILLATDLRNTKNLKLAQLTGKTPPLLCNVALPDSLTEVDPNRDCDQMPQVLAKRYTVSLGEATQWVNEAKQKQWD
ncbi:pentapeptide repeat-containing protein, partial [Leptolyngbya sp. FACHB-711]|uniref:nSTAND1 domain-containing NTPase n=1 Tax=Leptolyngbya sp. FACHB-711 TaxID=2692813 RepID=UPI0016869E66